MLFDTHLDKSVFEHDQLATASAMSLTPDIFNFTAHCGHRAASSTAAVLLAVASTRFSDPRGMQG